MNLLLVYAFFNAICNSCKFIKPLALVFIFFLLASGAGMLPPGRPVAVAVLIVWHIIQIVFVALQGRFISWDAVDSCRWNSCSCCRVLFAATADGPIHSFTRSLTQLRLQLPKSQTLYAGKQTIRGTRSHTHTHAHTCKTLHTHRVTLASV